MKYVIAIMVLFLVGCGNGNADSHNIHIGDVVTVKKGFYKGCRGWVADYSDYDSIKDTVIMKDVTCNNVTATIISVNAEDCD